MSLPSALKDVDCVRDAVECAAQAAKDKHVPLTIERLALTLGMSTQDLSSTINGHKTEFDGDKATAEVLEALKKAVQQSLTDLVEHGLVSRNMIFDMFLLKCNHGYNDKPEQQQAGVVINLVGQVPD